MTRSIFHVILNENSIVELIIKTINRVVKTRNGIMKHVNVSVETIAHARKIIV